MPKTAIHLDFSSIITTNPTTTLKENARIQLKNWLSDTDIYIQLIITLTSEKTDKDILASVGLSEEQLKKIFFTQPNSNSTFFQQDSLNAQAISESLNKHDLQDVTEHVFYDEDENVCRAVLALEPQFNAANKKLRVSKLNPYSNHFLEGALRKFNKPADSLKYPYELAFNTAKEGNAEALDFLFKQYPGMDIDYRNSEGKNLLTIALYYGHTLLANLLLTKFKADITQVFIPYFVDDQIKREHAITAIHFLFANAKININQPEPLEGQTALHKAAMYANIPMLQALVLSLNANVNQLNYQEHPPLHYLLTFKTFERCKGDITPAKLLLNKLVQHDVLDPPELTTFFTEDLPTSDDLKNTQVEEFLNYKRKILEYLAQVSEINNCIKAAKNSGVDTNTNHFQTQIAQWNAAFEQIQNKRESNIKSANQTSANEFQALLKAIRFAYMPQSLPPAPIPVVLHQIPSGPQSGIPAYTSSNAPNPQQH